MNINLESVNEEEWSSWIPVFPPDEQDIHHRGPGVLRVCHTKVSGIHYVGHSKRNLQARVRNLGYQLEKEKMPYTNPFSAAPCLWAMKEELGGEFYVSYIEASDSDTAEVLEDAYLTIYRLATSQSPTANYGQMFAEYSKSTNSERGIRGEKGEGNYLAKPIRTDSISVTNISDVTSSEWIGFNWQDPVSYYPDRLQGLSPSFPRESGIFRVWKEGHSQLEGVGTARNLGKEITEAVPDKNEDWLISFCVLDFSTRSEIREIESLLLGSHYIATEATTDVWENVEHQVRSLIEMGETEETEFKREIPGQANKVVKEILAIANTRGGQLILGVDDNRAMFGLPNPQETKERVVDLIDGNAESRLPVEFETVNLDGNDLLVIFIDEATNHPFASKDGIFYRRDGPQTNRMVGQDLKKWHSLN